jgi:hypothetical protein
MKKAILLLVFAGFGLFITAFITVPAPGPDFPDEVAVVLKNSCFDCHSAEGSSKKALLALNFDKWDGFKDTKKISKLSDICELVEEGKMPPGKYLANKPDRALTDAHKELLCSWAEEESAKLMEGN